MSTSGPFTNAINQLTSLSQSLSNQINLPAAAQGIVKGVQSNLQSLIPEYQSTQSNLNAFGTSATQELQTALSDFKAGNTSAVANAVSEINNQAASLSNAVDSKMGGFNSETSMITDAISQLQQEQHRVQQEFNSVQNESRITQLKINEAEHPIHGGGIWGTIGNGLLTGATAGSGYLIADTLKPQLNNERNQMNTLQMQMSKLKYGIDSLNQLNSTYHALLGMLTDVQSILKTLGGDIQSLLNDVKSGANTTQTENDLNAALKMASTMVSSVA